MLIFFGIISLAFIIVTLATEPKARHEPPSTREPEIAARPMYFEPNPYEFRPLFSHDRTHIWNGREWVRYESHSWAILLIGLIVGLIIGAAWVYFG
jgi:hypothetical protein